MPLGQGMVDGAPTPTDKRCFFHIGEVILALSQAEGSFTSVLVILLCLITYSYVTDIYFRCLNVRKFIKASDNMPSIGNFLEINVALESV
jgi:hypothetical protein